MSPKIQTPMLGQQVHIHKTDLFPYIQISTLYITTYSCCESCILRDNKFTASTSRLASIITDVHLTRPPYPRKARWLIGLGSWSYTLVTLVLTLEPLVAIVVLSKRHAHLRWLPMGGCACSCPPQSG